MWKMLLDDFRFAQPELQAACIRSFMSVIELNECRNIRGDYFRRCVNNLRGHK